MNILKRKTKILIAVLSVLYILIMGCIAYFIKPFIKSNDLILVANTKDIISVDEDYKDAFISLDDFKSLQIVEGYDFEEVYIELKTKKKIKILSIDRVSVNCDIKAYVMDDNWDEIAEYNDEKEIVFKFSNLRWNVIKVK